MPNLYIISGCNGAGKTTASYTMLPEMLECKEFINADEIAKGLSPFQPEKASIEAGRIMIRRMEEMLRLQQDFAIETTLATKSYVSFIKKAQKVGYFVTLLYFWLSSPELAIKRVEDRVKAGGHHVPQDVVRRRYRAGAQNLFTLYTPIADYWLVVNNSENPFCLVAEGKRSDMIEKHNEDILNKIKNI
ncbi:putative ABC-type ATPase [Dysgonomonas alginatilytica]|uniref:Putative ABC-type ATPase n=1 Tax=Dysgonomonas alginatilytica TaxID=1605892 RepID=A0A2V3PVG8_9BACT|nr:zeta toxin family protein [Dysgonomonas alginatilytica]PXV68794.1 putative ABC-type ATPase [Dysgonomonas alginatilytica]